MDLTPLMHGVDWSGEDVSGWYLTEKLDGMRAWWTGRELLSRTRATFRAPAWFLAQLPPTPLDGELWAGRGGLPLLQRIAFRAGGEARDWERVQFCPFDLPQQSMKIETAIEALRPMAAGLNFQPLVPLVTFSTAAAISAMREVCAGGGEGVMLRRPGTGYNTFGRSRNLLKLKPRMVGP